ncbi:MAG: hypothetical protein ABIG98_01730 [Chloroflexota bacterium]
MKEEYESPQMVTEKAEIGTLLASGGSPLPISTASGMDLCDRDGE